MTLRYFIFQILAGFEYGGGIKNLKVGVAEFSDITPKFQLTPIPEISSIRSIMYNDMNMVLRKAVSYQSISIFKASFTTRLA
jgi:hypothetical protein